MAFYDVILKPSVKKDLRALSATVRARVLARLEQLREESLPRQAVKLAGGEAWYRVRVDDYRIIYGVDTQTQQITVHYI
jgi:mRNA interferase RelE/StbE